MHDSRSCDNAEMDSWPMTEYYWIDAGRGEGIAEVEKALLILERIFD
jgi:hypothetical protein